MQTRRRVVGKILMAPALVALAACGPQPSASGLSGTLQVWTDVGQEREAMMNEVADAFVRGRPAVKIEANHSDAKWQDRLTTAVAAGTPPDVAYLTSRFVPMFGESAILDLTPYMNKTKGAGLTEMFEPSGVDLIKRWGMGKPLGLPGGSFMILMFYNRDAFAERNVTEPVQLYDRGQWNWNASVDAATKLHKPEQRLGYDADLDVYRVIAFANANGGRMFDEAQK